MENSVILNAADVKDDVLETTTEKILAEPKKIYLLSASLNMKLCNVIDSLSKTLKDKAALTCVRFAYNIYFELETEIRIGNSGQGVKVQSLAEILDNLDFDENLILKPKDYHIVIDDSGVEKEKADRAVAELFQQTVFLNINLDVQKKSEIEKALIKERFRANYQKLREQIDRQKKYLEDALAHANLTEHGKERIANMITAFEKTIEEVKKAKKRPIKIAAMGTKKAGKSVVINSLLKRDYAPTSSELPTPNVIKYIPAAADSELTLVYKGEKKPFNSAEKLSEFIGKEFEEAQNHTGEGSGLEDMTIFYPSADLSGYEVWDTPGPNFAGAGEEHQKIANECIAAADVCIFVMNYSNHLTNDEVKFLNQIHDTFEKTNKFYSLFITVNRIDERYSAEVEKSINRVLDYIGGRLEELDYKNIVIFGTSALQSFYLDKVLSILKSLDMEVDEDDTFFDVVRMLKKKHREFMVPVRFIEDALKNLEDFHNIDIEDADAKTLENFSGVPQLWRHVKYIGGQKVDTEIVDSVIGNCERQFTKIRTALLVTAFQDLSEEDKKRLEDLERKIDDLSNTVSKAMSEIENLVNNGDAVRLTKYDLKEEIDSIKRDAIKETRRETQGKLDEAKLEDSDVEQIQAGKKSDNMEKLMALLGDMITRRNSRSEQLLIKILESEGVKFNRKIEEKVQGKQQEILAETERVKKAVGGDDIAGNMIREFNLPKFPISLNKLSSSFNKLNSTVTTSELSRIAKASTRIDQETRTRKEIRERDSDGIWEGIRSFFGKKYYEKVDVNYTVDVIKADANSFKENVKRLLQDEIIAAIEDSHEEMKDDVINKFSSICADVQKQCGEIIADYKNIFDKLKEDIDSARDETSAHKKAIEHDIGVLVDIEKNITPFFDFWRDVLDGKAVG